MLLSEIPNIIYDLCDMILNGSSVTTPDGVIDGTGIHTPPLNIKIRSSDSNTPAVDEIFLSIGYAPITFLPKDDIMQYSYNADTEELTEEHNVPFDCSMQIRDVGGLGDALQLLQRYKDHDKVNAFTEAYNMSFEGINGTIVPIPFAVGEDTYRESVATYNFSFIDDYELLRDYYNTMGMSYEVLNKKDEIVIEGDVDYSLIVESE